MSAFPVADLAIALEALPLPSLQACFLRQNEFLFIEDFLPAPCLEALLDALAPLASYVHRNFIPGHKQGGSIGRHTLEEAAPVFAELYKTPALLDFLAAISGKTLLHCPSNDPHSYALYYYTERGDHIGYHYDTSYYRGSRYTVLIGLVDNSSCRLECQLNREDAGRETQTLSIALKPGALVVFNGDKLFHRVTPLGEGQQRIALTLEYVTSIDMNPLRRFISNMKDAIAYFGFKQVFRSRLP